MSGYRRKKRLVHVAFGPDDGDLAGLEITTHGMSLSAYLDLVDREEDAGSTALAESLREFARRLVSWNLQDEDGTPVPATEEAVYAEDHSLMLKVINRWFTALAGVHSNDPLSDGSPAGGPSPEVSIPMVPLSESPALSPVPS